MTACPSGWFCLLSYPSVEILLPTICRVKCPLGWTSGNEFASCVIDDVTKQFLIRFTGLCVVAEENTPKISMEWEYTPGDALQSEPLQLQSSFDDGKSYQNVPSGLLPACDEDCRMSMPLNLTLTRRPILLRLKGAESGAESAPFQRWQTAKDCREGSTSGRGH